MRARNLAGAVAIVLMVAACGNASTSSSPSTTAPPGGGGSSVTEATGAALKQNVPVSAQGVSNTSIDVAVITARSNILQGKFGDFANGIKAYFNYMNNQGGIYGRQLKVTADRDDGMLQDEQTVKQSLASDKAFATFVATPLFSGAVDIAAQPSMPTFIWNINPEMTGHLNIFGTQGALCLNCIAQGGPFLAQQYHFTKVAVLGYGTTASSKQCASAQQASFKKYPSAQVVFFDNELQFAQADLSADVGQIKAKGAQLIFTCIDAKESIILGKELVKEQVNAVQVLPNAYDQQFVQQNAQYLEGAFSNPQFVPFEYLPLLPEEQTMMTWMHNGGFEVNELSTNGWIAANEFVTGLKLAGPNFSQQKVIDSLNRDTHYDANGMIVPIDWTIQHNDPRGPGGTHIPKYSSQYNCAATVRVQGGTFVTIPSVPPTKPWVCMTGGPNSPTLTKTPEYMSFAPTSG